MFKKLYQWYGSLPKPIQVALATAEAAAAEAGYQWFENGGLRFDKASLHQLGSLVVIAVALSLHNLFKPNGNPPTPKGNQ